MLERVLPVVSPSDKLLSAQCEVREQEWTLIRPNNTIILKIMPVFPVIHRLICARQRLQLVFCFNLKISCMLLNIFN